jgi:two-component system sensor histidine kinase PhoQ
MNKLSLSLKSRQMIVFFGIIVLVLPLVFLSIEQAFRQSQVKALEQQLEANLYTIIGEIDLDAEQVDISSASLPPLLNQGDSGTLALIEQTNKVIWRSDSALNLHPVLSRISNSPGESTFVFSDHYWRYSYALFYDNEFGTYNLVLHVLQHESTLAAQVDKFRQIIIRWFGAIALVLIAALAFGLWSTLAPIKKLDLQIKQVEKGMIQFISGDFPKELTRVKEDLNLLISAQERQKNRYRSYLSDLTHALKTPVAVLKSSPSCTEPDVTEQLDRMTSIIEHQLRKASSGGEDVWKKKTTVNPVLDKLIRVMSKIHAAKDIAFEHQLYQQHHFYGDEDDLMEILGNLIDNACKACVQQVKVSVTQAKPLILMVEDDGPGIKPSQREKLLVRGQRLDTYAEGHGVGMAIVSDLVESYQGTLEISDSPMGGAKFIVSLATNSH